MTLDELKECARNRALTENELKALLRERNSLGASGEAKWLEMKQGLATSGHRKREDWTKLLAEAISISNSGGGYIIFGVGDAGELIGVDGGTIDLLDPSRIQDQLNRYSPECRLTTQLTVASYYGKTYAGLWISPAARILLFDVDGDYTAENGSQKQAFKKGVLYVRDSGGRRRASQTDLDRLVQRQVEDRLATLVARIERVIHVPLESDLLASHPENSSQAYRLVERGEGQPVRITSDPDEPAVPLREVLRTDVPYEAANHEVSAQVRFWKTKPDHRVSREVCFSWFLRRQEINWNVDSATFCFLSACRNWGYPMFWGRWLFDHEQAALRNIIKDILASPRYPEIEYVPYIALAFFWEERNSILSEIQDCGYMRASQTAQRLQDCSDKRTFVLEGRSSSSTIRIEGEQYVKDELLEHHDIAVQALEKVVELRRDAAHGDIELEHPGQLSGAGHHLDLICYTPFDES